MMQFETRSDEELAVQAADSVEAEGVLLSRYLRLIRFHAGRFAEGADVDDYVQEGLIALLYAIPQYDPEKEVRFSTYAQTCICNRMRSVYARSQRNPIPAEGLEDFIKEELIDPDTPESILLQKESYQQFQQQVMTLLSEKEWQILECIMDGATYAETAAKLDIDRKSVDNAMQRIRRKMRAVRSTDYFD